MIVFYTENKKVKEVVSIKEASVCSTACTSNCIKPKNKCCNKYKKKGINCKRCPLTFDVKIAS
ncbi:hypothetical protein [Tenacibaculum holothuriorum]|uniref:hypothetical protein n=1 Tax=Tenacibaculum holothuriorum TaxID=1635173 RepID=UPI00117FBCCD|nr:hypothetical protein [Tenacibaculum holothuriorum]